MMSGLQNAVSPQVHSEMTARPKVNSLDDLLVHQGGAIELGVVEPREECDLDHVVERDVL